MAWSSRRTERINEKISEKKRKPEPDMNEKRRTGLVIEKNGTNP
jgi:hypothetical protein